MTTLRDMLAEVAAHYELAPERLLQRDQHHVIAHARHAFMWHARQVKRSDGAHRYSLPRIGLFLGGMNHTSVLHGVRQHAKRLRKENGTPVSSAPSHVHDLQGERRGLKLGA